MKKVKWKKGEIKEGLIEDISNDDYRRYKRRVILLDDIDILECEICKKNLIWGVDKGMFQTGESKRFFHKAKSGNFKPNVATFCSKRCLNKFERDNQQNSKRKERNEYQRNYYHNVIKKRGGST